MVVVLVLGASGMPAACTRPLTAVALANTAAVPRKPLREIMVFSSINVRHHPRQISPGGYSFVSVVRSAAARDGCLEVHSCQPEVALRLDGSDGRRNALARLRKERKHVD